MSEAVSALNGAAHEGFARIQEQGLRGMVTLRGDLDASAFRKAVKGVAGVDVPAARSCKRKGDKGVAWMSPDELLLMVPYAEAEQTVAALDKALTGQFHLAVNVSDARAVFAISGKSARESLAKLAPVDLSPGAFRQGDFRRTRLAQVPAAFWMTGDDAFELVCFRSVASYVFELLGTAAESAGEVRYF